MFRPKKESVSRQQTIARLRQGRSGQRVEKKRPRYHLVAGALMTGIVVLVMIQLTSLAQHTFDSTQTHNTLAKEGPIFRALQEQRNALDQARGANARRRLNTTHNNSEAIVVSSNITKDQAKTREDNSTATNQSEPAVNDTETPPKSKVRFMKGAHLLNRTAIREIQKEKKREMRPFQLMRSVPDPPSDFLNRTKPVDVIGDPTFDISKLKPTNYTLRSKWHGVLLDAGRHYFEVKWIYRMLDVLAVLQYNCLHFRLTDDQAWNVRLESQPDLAHPVGILGHGNVYTPGELRDIVAYAKTKGITIWPEINVPGHGGGWAGIPGLIVQCPQFICEKGYGVPINVTHPKFRGVLRDVLQEIIEIFDHPPYLHLGGDEVDMALPCFQELGLEMFDYDPFETELKSILDDVGYPEDQVIRWEMTGQRLNSPQTGKMPQYWYRIPGESAQDWGKNKFFASGGLYFDFNEMDMAWKVFLHTRRYYHLPKDNFPIGIIVGTFELDASFWFDRNVVGRLLAVTMGASTEIEADNGSELYDLYRSTCREVGFDDSLCKHYGLPFIPWLKYKAKWKGVWTLWKNRICNRLTIPVDDFLFVKPDEQPPKQSRSYANFNRIFGTNTKEKFWDVFGARENATNVDIHTLQFEALQHKPNLTALTNRLVPNVGIVMDLTLLDDSEMDLSDFSLIHHMHSLGLNLIQLRLASDHLIAYKSEAVPQATALEPNVVPSIHDIRSTLVGEASRMSIGVMPEISLSTNAAGLYEINQNVECPRYLCATGHGVQDIHNSDFVSTSYLLTREIGSIATSGMIHLGSDERISAEKCFTEAAMERPDYDAVEKKLAYLLEFDGITAEQIVRWSNEEGVEYPGRLGKLTQCRSGDCRTNSTSQWIASVDLEKGGAYDIFNAARELALRKPVAILAEIGKMDRASIDTNQMTKRILAFAMGISDLSEWSRGMFEDSFINMCTSLFGADDVCSDFAKSDSGVEQAAAREEQNRELVCQTRTKTIQRRVYRPEFQEPVVSVEIKAA